MSRRPVTVWLTVAGGGARRWVASEHHTLDPADPDGISQVMADLAERYDADGMDPAIEVLPNPEGEQQ